MQSHPPDVLVATWLPEQVIGAAWAKAENAIDSANMSAVINNVMRFLIPSHPLSLGPNQWPKERATDHPLLFGWGSRLRHWLCARPLWRPSFLGRWAS